VGRCDDALARPVVADGAAGGLDPARQRGFAHEAVAPDRVEQLLLAHHPVRMGRQVHQHVEDLRLDRYEQAGAAQLIAIEIELAVAEGEDHARPLQDGRRRPSVANRTAAAASRCRGRRQLRLVHHRCRAPEGGVMAGTGAMSYARFGGRRAP
jgi:hypothetical protein